MGLGHVSVNAKLDWPAPSPLACRIRRVGGVRADFRVYPSRDDSPRTEDVSSIDAIMRAFYEVIDLPPNAPRQWARDRTLYSPWIHFVASGKKLQIWDHQQFVDHADPGMREGVREREIFRTVRRYGNIAHVDSTYEMRSGTSGKLARGVNSLELYFDGQRWWIASNIWQSEDTEHPIPPELLPPPTR